MTFTKTQRKIVVTLLIIILLIGNNYKTIFQEGNPLPIFSAIIKATFTSQKIVTLKNSPEKYLTPSDHGKELIIQFMKEKGYTFIYQLGSGYIFKNEQGKGIAVTRKAFSRFFEIWHIPEVQIKN